MCEKTDPLMLNLNLTCDYVTLLLQMFEDSVRVLLGALRVSAKEHSLYLSSGGRGAGTQAVV